MVIPVTVTMMRLQDAPASGDDDDAPASGDDDATASGDDDVAENDRHDGDDSDDIPPNIGDPPRLLRPRRRLGLPTRLRRRLDVNNL